MQRDLHDSQSCDVSADWRFNIAYNAALQSAKAALAAAGYRTARGGDSHGRTLDSLTLTVGLDPLSVRRLQAFRKRRNTTEYDHAGVTSDAEVDEMRALAEAVRHRVLEWLRAEHQSLLR